MMVPSGTERAIALAVPPTSRILNCNPRARPWRPTGPSATAWAPLPRIGRPPARRGSSEPQNLPTPRPNLNTTEPSTNGILFSCCLPCGAPGSLFFRLRDSADRESPQTWRQRGSLPAEGTRERSRGGEGGGPGQRGERDGHRRKDRADRPSAHAWLCVKEFPAVKVLRGQGSTSSVFNGQIFQILF